MAAAACLGRADRPYRLLEQRQAVGSTWRQHYDRLHLHTMRRHSNLPHRVMPGHWPLYPSRDQVVTYLEDYAQHFDIAAEFGTTAERIEQVQSGWQVHTNRGLVAGANLVMATGYNRIPNVPQFPGLETFPGPVFHSSEYTNGQRFSGERVLVIGCGNSGAEIALDLCEHGAHASMVVRGPTYVSPRDLLGRPAQQTSIMMSKLPLWLADALGQATLRWVVGDLSPWGIRRPDLGPLRTIYERGRVPILDVGTLDKIKSGAIAVRPGVRSIQGDRVSFSDERQFAYDAIVMATGYTTGLPELFPDHSQLFDRRGQPCKFGEQALPGLYFIGFRNPPTGGLREITLEAQRVTEDINRSYRPAQT